jgi:glycosyltransferase involved in cell wall biosynthesis
VSTLLVSAAGVLGGAERVLLDWGAGLDGEVALACPPGPLTSAAAHAGLAVVPLPMRRLQRRGRDVAAARDLAALAGDIARLAHRRRPALIVASGQRPLLAAAWIPRAGARLLGLLHDLPPQSPAGAALLRGAARRADALVATSAAIAAEAGAPAAVVHPGVDLGAWETAPEPPTRPPPRALCLGALVPWKRPDLALEIAARVPGLALDLAGEPLPGQPPEYVAALHARAREPDLAGRVRLLGHADTRAALGGAHVLLHCAEREPFGLALVEALAAGRPVVAAAAAGPLEIVTPTCGRLYAPGDAAAGAAALRAVLADPPPAAAARERAGAFEAVHARRRFAALAGATAARR